MFSFFFFFVINLFLSLRSLLSYFQHSRTDHCLYLRTSKSYFLEASHFLLFLLSNLFFIVIVLETITQTCLFLSLRSLLSCFQHSRTNHCPYLRTSKSYFLEVLHFLLFFFFCQKLVFEFEISSFLLSALKNKSLPIFENKANHTF